MMRILLVGLVLFALAGCAVQKRAPRPGSGDRPAPQARLAPAPTVSPPATVEAGPAAPRQPVGEQAQLALLLPLSGPYSDQAHWVADGFFTAYIGAGAQERIRVYDTRASEYDAELSYHAALKEGADLIIGPLTKTNVDQIASDADASIPVVALNFVDRSTFDARDDSLLQMGLSPEDEARAAARSARDRGLAYAVLLVVDSAWGRRIGAAFAAEFSALGGVISGEATFVRGGPDFSDSIKDVLGIAESWKRHRALALQLGAKPVFEPRRRGDVDTIFVAASAADARMLVPQLRFHRADDLPIYATAAANDGTYADREGVRFCETPVVLAKQGSVAAMRMQLQDAIGSEEPEALRLAGLGHDAYTVARDVLDDRLDAGEVISGLTGQLALDRDGVLRRMLPCAEISDEGLEALPEAVP
jgi:outer membrane PBP1 activator LpoA protein